MDPLAGTLVASAIACLGCDAAARGLILAHDPVLLGLTIAPGLLAGGFLAAWLVRRWVAGFAPPAAPAAWAAMLLGLGLGGFIDGILLHQVAQVHQMISRLLPPDTIPAKNANMFWDGIFHLAAWTLTLAGAAALWRLARRGAAGLAAGVLWSGMLLGWGAFNILDSVVNHYLLGYHDVVQASRTPWAWNLAFLVLGAAQAAIGAWWLRRTATARSSP